MPSEMSAAVARHRWIDTAALRQTFARAVAFRSLKVAALIGTILNTINQGPELVAGRHVNLVKLLLTYTVPFCVASYGAYAAFRSLRGSYEDMPRVPG